MSVAILAREYGKDLVSPSEKKFIGVYVDDVALLGKRKFRTAVYDSRIAESA